MKEKFTVEFQFKANQVVGVPSFGIQGEVTDCSIDRNQIIKYWVEWVDSDMNVVGRWFEEDRLELIKE